MIIICADQSEKYHHYLKSRKKSSYADIEKDKEEKDKLIKKLKARQISLHDEIFELVEELNKLKEVEKVYKINQEKLNILYDIGIINEDGSIVE